MGRRFLSSAFAVAGLVCSVSILRAEVPGASDAGAPPPGGRASQAVSSAMVNYRTPAISLTREDGRTVLLARELDDGRPVLLNFIFTSCPSICPLASQTFAEFQRRLGADAAAVHLLSISIDPEQDTPARLLEYARKFHARPGWQHYTGSLADSVTAQRAFDVYRGNKMSHTPVTLMRAAPGQPWLRIEGFVTPDELVQDYRRLLAGADAIRQEPILGANASR